MRLLPLLFASASILFISCSERSKNINPVLNKDALQSQFFQLNIERDTTLLTKSGCVIKIPAGSLQSDSTMVKLEIREAISATDIVLGGLRTMSNNKILSSGGMIYFNAAKGYKLSVKKPVELLIPTNNFNPNMQVFKGEEKDGKINWEDPEPLPKDSTIAKIENGKQLFKMNCANCHKVNMDYTGPALYYATARLPRKWIYDFVHNPAGSNDPYSRDIKDKWKPTVMTAFPNLDSNAIDCILAYIKIAHDNNLEEIIPEKPFNDGCFDSCRSYLAKVDFLKEEKKHLLDSNGIFFSLDRNIPIPPPASEDTFSAAIQSNVIDPGVITKVVPTSIKATFYSVQINSTGWFNVDAFLDNQNNAVPSELFVNVQHPVNADFSVSLIVPKFKVFTEGGKLDKSEQYGFHETNGKIPLTQNIECYVIAIGEANGKLYFGISRFISKKIQTINVQVIEMSKEDIQARIKSLNLNGVDFEIKNAPNAEKIKQIEQKQNDAEIFKPKNCNCGEPSADSSDINTLPIAAR